MEHNYRIILSGGGTGGHIYPAIAVAETLKKRLGDNVCILFVGAEGKMEMEKVPALGYDIIGLPVAGLQRRVTISNLALPVKVMRSVRKAREIIRAFKADIVVGFGGYASGPVLWGAQRMGLPTVIQEQNSYAGLTNKLLARRADKICVAYDRMDKFFPASKITLTGNPLRGNFTDIVGKKADALKYFGLKDDRPVLLILGGSLGTRTLNNMMKVWVDEITSRGRVQVIWQTGKFYEKEMEEYMTGRNSEGIWRSAFIERMDYAYAAADIIVSRSGANTISELCLIGKPTIFVPSPNVAEDHQTKNAKALVDMNAALMISDDEAVRKVIPAVEKLLDDKDLQRELARNISSLAAPDSADRIVDIIIELANISGLRRRLNKISIDGE